MTKQPSAHSSIIGGSTADRVLSCPGSVQATLALPPQIKTSSPYAEEGTFAHAVMEHLLLIRKAAEEAGTETDMHRDAESLIGEHIYDRVVTHAHLDELIDPALEALADLEELYEGDFTVAAVELSVKYPGVPGAFGTIDLIMVSPTHVLHVDWKFGGGVPVKAVYKDGTSELVNPQLVFYVVAARNTKKPLYSDRRRLIAAIIQPRAEPKYSDTEITPRDLKYFREDVENALVMAMSPSPPRVKGEHCRFAPCKVTCPLWTGPLIEMALLKPQKSKQEDLAARTPTAFGEYLARAKALADIAALFKSTIDEQLHAFLANGGVVPGWRLKAKTKQRQWVDEKVVGAELRALGFEDSEIWQIKLQTFASVDRTAKRKGVTIPEALRIAPQSTETTIATTDDPAPVVEPNRVLEMFQAAAKALAKG